MQGHALTSQAHRDAVRRHAVRARARYARLVYLAALCALMFSARAHAQQPGNCDASRPVIEIEVRQSALAPLTREHFLLELRVAVARWGLNLCTGSAETGAPLARVVVASSGRKRIGIRVRDPATQEEVARDADLSALPEDVHGEAVALAVEELLKASWLGLALTDEVPSPAPEQPQPLRSELRQEAAQSRHRPLSFGVRGALDMYSRGATLAGADLFLTAQTQRLLGAQASVGARKGTPYDAEHGRIALRTLNAEVAFVMRAFERRSFTLLFPVALNLSWVTFTGIADAGDLGRTRAGLTVAMSCTPSGILHLGQRTALVLALGPGRVLRGVAAQDEGRTAFALAGWSAHAHLGVAVRL